MITKLTEEAYQFINDRPESLNDDLYQWAVDAEIIIWDLCKALAAAPGTAQREPLTADDLREPKNGTNWRVEWWNEAARLMLPANKRLDSFQSYKNGTLMFTLKEQSND